MYFFILYTVNTTYWILFFNKILGGFATRTDPFHITQWILIIAALIYVKIPTKMYEHLLENIFHLPVFTVNKFRKLHTAMSILNQPCDRHGHLDWLNCMALDWWTDVGLDEGREKCAVKQIRCSYEKRTHKMTDITKNWAHRLTKQKEHELEEGCR